MVETPALKKACEQCPWRLTNQGKKHKFGFYTKANLRRLWNQVRNGGLPQSCHLTDPSHPDHVASGCKENSVPRECPGSIIVVQREIQSMADETNTVTAESTKAYLVRRKRFGLTRSGLLYWLNDRIRLGGVPFFGGPKFPDVDDDPAIGLPEQLREG